MKDRHNKPPHRHGYLLTEEGMDLYDEFYIGHEESGCSCHICPPCGYCTHPGNPDNIKETDSLWVPDPSVEGCIQF